LNFSFDALEKMCGFSYPYTYKTLTSYIAEPPYDLKKLEGSICQKPEVKI
jgi:hypothetical protein